MAEANFVLKRRVEYDMDLTLENLPFGMEVEDIDNCMDVKYDMQLGDVVVVELCTSDFERRLVDYKKSVVTSSDNETVYADEYCMIRGRVYNSGNRYYELIIPLVEDWEDMLSDEEMEVELW